MTVEDFGLFQDIIEHLGLHLIDLLNAGQAAQFLQPITHQAQNVDTPTRGRILHGIVIRLDLPIQHHRSLRHCMTQQILAHDDDGQTRRCQILLCTCVDHAVLAHVYGLTANIGRHIANDGHITGFRHGLPLGAVNGVVGAIVKISRIGPHRQCIGNIAVVCVLGRTCHRRITVALSLFPRGGGKVAGEGIICLSGQTHQVQRDGGKLGGCTALQEQNLVVLRNLHNRTKFRLGFVKNLGVNFGTVAHFHNGHATAAVIEHFLCGTFQNRNR